jgi:hypothetical protein
VLETSVSFPRSSRTSSRTPPESSSSCAPGSAGSSPDVPRGCVRGSAGCVPSDIPGNTTEVLCEEPTSVSPFRTNPK